MTENILPLIHRILNGEETAFTELVQIYQKRIHALVWRKIGDYHIAEEITQDIFLQIYKRLPTLKNPKQFDGWLYVIANRFCINWIKKNKVEKDKLKIQSLEDTSLNEIAESFYAHHESDQRETERVERYQEILKKLLEILPESDRTIVTLHYLGEMTIQEISKFLGVSVNTIKSRLHRARNRLKEKEELLMTENLGSIQLSMDLTESIMKQISDIKPAPPIGQPILPWAALGTAAVVVMLLLGAINQYITHFQKPYDFTALSEPIIEIVESPIHVDIVPKPIERNKISIGRINSNSEGASTMGSDVQSTANVEGNTLNSSVDRWTQANGPHGTPLDNIFATTDNNIYAVSRRSIYRLAEDGETWININATVPINMHLSFITEHQGVFYSVDTDEIFASTDDGITWKKICSRPKGVVVGLIINSHTQDNSIMYLALKNKGVFKTINTGKKWIALNKGLERKIISAFASVENSMFIGTSLGLYRLNLGVWHQLPVEPLKAVHSMTVFENNLYVVTGPDFISRGSSNTNSLSKSSLKIFHLADSGSSWRDITPKDANFIISPLVYHNTTKIFAVDKTLLVFGIMAFRSKDGGQTWTNLGFDINHYLQSVFPRVLAVNENTFYTVGPLGITRTTDSGDSWHTFTNGIMGTKVKDLIVFDNRLYVYTGSGFYKSADDGNSWGKVDIDYGELGKKLKINTRQPDSYFTDAKLVLANNILYGIIPFEGEQYIFRLQPDNDTFLMVHRITYPKKWGKGEEPQITDMSNFGWDSVYGEVIVSNNTFYTEYRRRLFKWTLGNIEVIDTGLTDTSKPIENQKDSRLKIAASSEVVYVGTRNGKLHQSMDDGNNWKDITSTISSIFSYIKDITFFGTTVYVATDKGILTSETGERWRLLTDNIGTHIIIDRFAVYGSNFYGAGDTGVYKLDSLGRWVKVIGNVPDKVTSLSVSNDKLYFGTEKHGIFHTTLD